MSVREQQLIGTWVLERFVITYADGRPPLHPFGEQARGRILYAPDGYMSAVLCRGDRPPLGVGSLERAGAAGEAARAAAFDSYLSYAGAWRLEGDEVHHEVREALVPDAVGATQTRAARLEGGRLTLSYPLTPRSGITRTYTLTWRRPDE